MKRLLNALLVVAVMLGAVTPPALAITDFNPSGDTGSSSGTQTQTNFPGVIPETRFRSNVRFPNQAIFGGDQNVNAPFNGTNSWTNIPCMILRPANKRSRDGLDTTIKWTTPTATRTYTIPDAGASTANFVLDQGNYTIGGTWTFTNALTLAANSVPRSAIQTDSAVRVYNEILGESRNLNGSVVSNAAAAGNFGVTTTATFGSPANLLLVSEAAQGNTKTDAVEFEFMLPTDYVAGSNITVNVASNVTGGGTLGATKTLTVDAFKVDPVLGTVGSNLGPAAGTLATGAAVNQAFVITPTGLNPGDKLLIQVQAAVQETGGVSAINANVTGINITCDVKG